MTDTGGSTPSGPVKMWNYPIEAYQDYARETEESKGAIAKDSIASTNVATSSRLMTDQPTPTEFDKWFSVRVTTGTIRYDELPRTDRYYAQVQRSGLQLFGSVPNIESSMEVVQNFCQTRSDENINKEGEIISSALKQIKEDVNNVLTAYGRMGSLRQG
jgi:hypothetical protein